MVALEQELPPGDTLVETDLKIDQPRLWQMNDPYLYRVTARVGDDGALRLPRVPVRQRSTSWGRLRGRGCQQPGPASRVDHVDRLIVCHGASPWANIASHTFNCKSG